MIFGLLRRAPATDRADPALFARFLARRAAFLAQKTVLDYCRVKSLRDEERLFRDPDFLAALRHCRWQVYLAGAGDVAVMAEAALRPHAPGREEALAEDLAAILAAAIRGESPPEAEREAAEAAILALPGRLAAARLAPPAAPHRQPLLAEAPLFATLPVHPDQRAGEGAAIRGALRFHHVSAAQEMERLFDLAALAPRLALAPRPPAAPT